MHGGGLSQYASEMGAESSMVGQTRVNRASLGGISQYASDLGASSMGGAMSAMNPSMGGVQGRLSTAGVKDREPAFRTAREVRPHTECMPYHSCFVCAMKGVQPRCY